MIFPSGSILGEAKYTNKREECQIYLSIAERKYIGRSQITNKREECQIYLGKGDFIRDFKVFKVFKDLNGSIAKNKPEAFDASGFESFSGKRYLSFPAT